MSSSFFANFTPEEIITHLTLESFMHRKAHHDALEKIRLLEKEQEKLEKELQKTIPVSYISDFVSEQFTQGKIPYPEEVLEDGGTVVTYCGPEHILFGEKDTISAEVVFSLGRNRSFTYTYVFYIKPDNKEYVCTGNPS